MILDASVVLKWIINESDSTEALVLAGRPDGAAPTTLNVEAGYVLTKMVRQRLITAGEARAAWIELSAAGLRLVGDDGLLRSALELSLRLSANYYDCLYLALAVIENDVLVTADERFVRAVRAAPDLHDRILTLAEATAA
jgi:predicted nucleic acid-binding protein